MERKTGFEPATSTLARLRATNCATSARVRHYRTVRSRMVGLMLAEPFDSGSGAESQNRTGDTAIFSRVLYQLSYLGPVADRAVCPSAAGEYHASAARRVAAGQACGSLRADPGERRF